SVSWNAFITHSLLRPPGNVCVCRHDVEAEHPAEVTHWIAQRQWARYRSRRSRCEPGLPRPIMVYAELSLAGRRAEYLGGCKLRCCRGFGRWSDGCDVRFPDCHIVASVARDHELQASSAANPHDPRCIEPSC